MVNWDPVLHTALSDLEVLSEEEKGSLWHLRYPLIDNTHEGKNYLVVATTRPETMLGDTAVAVHPEDERFTHLVGTYVELPLTGRKIPIIADEYVDPEFGSGCVKITPAHDFNDYQVWTRHRDSESMQEQPHAGLINVFTDDAAIRENEGDQLIPEQYVNLDRYDARKQIVSDLEKQGLLERIDDHKLMIPRGDRSGAVVEPYLTDQWYVDLTREKLADGRPGGKTVITDPSIQCVRDGRIEFVPENWSKTYYQWLENIEDWCISRQIWWGHRIPAWYDLDGNVYVGRNETEVREKYELGEDIQLKQDDDVLDTWFSSALWPFSTLGWPEQTERLKTFYPTSVLVTGFDIIFFWVARMIMMGTKFMGEVPFKQVYIHGLVRDAHGQKMSKSKGNVLDPIDLIDGIELEALVEKRTKGLMQPHLAEKIKKQTRQDFPKGIPSFGTDALRFTFAALASNGRDINFDLNRTEGYKNFCNKIWNAARFVLMNTEGKPCGNDGEDFELNAIDRWVISKLQHTEQAVAEAFEVYRFDNAAREIYEFIWNIYCDWYLEFAKVILNSEEATDLQKVGTRRTLVRVLETALRLSHPFMPYITEEIWQQFRNPQNEINETISNQNFPCPETSKIDLDIEADISEIQGIIYAIRNLRSKWNISPKEVIEVILVANTEQGGTLLTTHETLITKVAKVNLIEREQTDQDQEISVSDQIKLIFPNENRIADGANREKIEKQLHSLIQEKDKLEIKLANTEFLNKAPAQVVEKVQTTHKSVVSKIDELEQEIKNFFNSPG